ncbi:MULTISPECIES: deaminase domain-containing protein [Micromonospora]|uniref:deaminase domain-containing protein n=1 Tax=Micromonospora TaxID=1873 RepID=UPI001112DD0C
MVRLANYCFGARSRLLRDAWRAARAGRLGLYFEREVCPSCSSVLDQFRGGFPGIQVNVSWG